MIERAKRAAIYARFSSELQDARSVGDQVALCREHAQRQCWTVIYADEAVSGATVSGAMRCCAWSRMPSAGASKSF
jgi:site-specific DNA recombinase